MIHIDIENKNLWLLLEWGGEKVYVTETLLSTWVVMGALILLAVIVRIRLRWFKDVPSGFQNVIEIAVESMRNLAKSTMGSTLEGLGGYFFSIFAFVLVSNYSGLVGLRPPTADLATTLPLALSSFLLIHGIGIFMQKGNYFKSYLSPSPILLPINIIGELAKPISLAFRLFGNILGGVIILELLYTMPPLLFRFVVPDIGHIYFDLFAGAIQAFIFTMLSMTFIQQKALTE